MIQLGESTGSEVHWILLVGPYWTPQVLGPFSEAKSTVHALKPSDSADCEEFVKVLDAKEKEPMSVPVF